MKFTLVKPTSGGIYFGKICSDKGCPSKILINEVHLSNCKQYQLYSAQKYPAKVKGMVTILGRNFLDWPPHKHGIDG